MSDLLCEWNEYILLINKIYVYSRVASQTSTWSTREWLARTRESSVCYSRTGLYVPFQWFPRNIEK
jgi:hypothetical protein